MTGSDADKKQVVTGEEKRLGVRPTAGSASLARLDEASSFPDTAAVMMISIATVVPISPRFTPVNCGVGQGEGRSLRERIYGQSLGICLQLGAI